MPILAKTWLPWQRRLDQCNQKCFLWIGRSRKRSVIISNHILAISRRNTFIAILVPKLVAMLLSLVYRSVTDEFLIAQTLSQNQTLHGNIIGLQLKLWPFCDIFAYFGQNLVAMATSLRHLQSELSSLDWSTTKTPCYK